MAEAFFGPQAGQDFVIRIEADAVPLHIASGYFFAEIANAIGNGIAMVPRVSERFFDFLDNLWIWRIRGIAHSEVNHVDARDTQLILTFVDGSKQVGGQPSNAVRYRNGKGIVFEENFRFAAHGDIRDGNRLPRQDRDRQIFRCPLF